jgi:hypothetical protein
LEGTLAIEIIYEVENYDIAYDLLLLFTEDFISNLNQRLSYLMDYPCLDAIFKMRNLILTTNKISKPTKPLYGVDVRKG